MNRDQQRNDPVEPTHEVRRWHVLAGFVQAIGAKSLLEVGCKEGRTTEFVAKNCPECLVTAIDPWIPQPTMAGVAEAETYEKWNFHDIAAGFQKRVDGLSNVVFYQRTSAEHEVALRSASVGVFDVIFIDAMHDYESVRADIGMWRDHVSPGGILSGHDYNDKHPGVMRAVAEAFCLMEVSVGPDSVWYISRGAYE